MNFSDIAKTYTNSSPSIVVMIPVFNDWTSLDMLLKNLDEVSEKEDIQSEVLVVDDASTIYAYDSFINSNFKAIKKVSIIELKRNLGHQRAIAVGLAYIEANVDCKAVVVMDGDGEDDPRDVPRLINMCNQKNYTKIVFAQRFQRSESCFFKLFYRIYKYLFKLLTAQHIEMGNFSIIPHKALQRVVVVSEIWSHYAAGVLKAKIPFVTLPCKRSTRIHGYSKMNFMSLVIHGLSAISIYGDTIGVKALVIAFLLMLIAVTSIFIILLVRIAVPNWAPYVAGISLIIFLQFLIISFFFVFLVLNSRNNFAFLPYRDYHYFILTIKPVFPNYKKIL